MGKLFLSFILLGFLLTNSKQITAQAKVGKTSDDRRGKAAAPSNFYIVSVLDERSSDSTSLVVVSSDGKSLTRKVSLESGTIKGIKRVLTKGSSENTSLWPLSVRVNELDIKETLSGDRVIGQATVVLMFDLIKESGPTLLTQYKSSVKYSRPLDNMSNVEPTLGQLLSNSLKFIDNWIAAEASTNPNLARGIALSFNDYEEQHEDTVYYDPQRPLVWDDFREKRSDSKFAASVFPSFGYDEATKMVNGIIHVDLVLKVYVVKSASWVGPGIRSNYNLEHEQRHFDLVKLVAERFKKKLLSEKLTPDNFQGIINFEYIEFYREMNRIQQEYDRETAHGTQPTAQEYWNRKVEAELKFFTPAK